MTTEPIQRKLQFVLEKYGIEPKENIKFSYFSMANEVFFINDEKHNKFVLKNCMKNNSLNLLNAEISLINHLNKNGCRCPEVIKDINNNSVIEYNGDFFVMYRHINGEFMTWNKKIKQYHLNGAIEGLAKYHKAVSNIDKNIDTDRIKSYNYTEIQNRCNNLKKTLSNDKSGRKSVQLMLEIIDDIIFFARKLPEFFDSSDLDNLDKTMVHGDFHPWNCVYRFYKFFGCYDFDFIRRDLRIFDISWILMIMRRRFYVKIFGWDKLNNKDFSPTIEQVEKIETDLLNWLVKQYRKFYCLSDFEISFLPAMEIARFLFTLSFFSLNNSEEECLRHHGWYKSTIDNINKFYDTWVKVNKKITG